MLLWQMRVMYAVVVEECDAVVVEVCVYMYLYVMSCDARHAAIRASSDSENLSFTQKSEFLRKHSEFTQTF